MKNIVQVQAISKILPIILFLSVFMIVDGHAQVQGNNPSCRLVDISKPAQYLKYSTLRGNDLIYEFINNFTCSVTLEIDGDEMGVTRVKQSNGTAKLTYHSPQNGDELTVHYLVLDLTKRPIFRLAFNVHAASLVKLGQSESIFFRVNKKTKGKLLVAVQYVFEWEDKGFSFYGFGGQQPGHLVYSE